MFAISSRARAVAELAMPAMGGVTHLMFAPDGRLLFSGSRKDDKIVCWDIRRTKEVGDFHWGNRAVSVNTKLASYHVVVIKNATYIYIYITAALLVT